MTENINGGAIALSKKENPDDKEDYIFRFKIEPREKPSDPDTVLVDFFRDELRDLLKVVFFCRNGEKIIPTEFGFLNDQDKKFTL